MSTISRPVFELPTSRAKGRIPPLYAGDRLTQSEFHRRYEAMPPHVKAELIGGIVYLISSPMRIEHGKRSNKVAMMLGLYAADTPGIQVADGATAILSPDSEPQPDHLLWLLPEHGGKTKLSERGYLTGPPELIVEIAHSTLAIDLHYKRIDYKKAGVQEYLVFCIDEGELRAFDLPSSKSRDISKDGIYRSHIFPGLWIDVKAVFAENAAKMLRTLRRGLKSREHAAFVRKIAAKPARRRK